MPPPVTIATLPEKGSADTWSSLSQQLTRMVGVQIDPVRLALFWVCAWDRAVAAPDLGALFAMWKEGEWQRFLQLADAETLLCRTIDRIDASQFPCPPSLRRGVEGRRATRKRWNAILAAASVDILQKISSHGVAACLLKGAALSAALYGADDVRDSRDIDILVPVEQLLTAAEVISRDGYTCQVDLGWLSDPTFLATQREISFHGLGGAIEIDLHWRLSNPWVSGSISEEELQTTWEHAVRVGNRDIAWFSPANLYQLAKTNILNSNRLEMKAVVDLIHCADLAGLDEELTSPFVHTFGAVSPSSFDWLLRGTVQVIGVCGLASKLPRHIVAKDLLNSESSEPVQPFDVWHRHFRRLTNLRHGLALIRRAISPTLNDYMSTTSRRAKFFGHALVRKTRRRK